MTKSNAMARCAAILTLATLATGCDEAPQACEMPGASAVRDGSWRAGPLRAWNNGVMLNGIVLHDLLVNGLVVDHVDEPAVGDELEAASDDGSTITLRVDAIQHEDGLTYFALSHDGQNVCGTEGGVGMFVPGAWDQTGAHDADADLWSYSCTTGVIAKCVMWGYAPWTVGTDAHQACTRMARADYCGDGTPYTRDGTSIEVFDTLGVAQPLGGPQDFEFEAAWGPDGATCVSRPRYDESVVGVGEVQPPCWDALPRCETWADALQTEARIANRSLPQPRLLCEARD